MNWNTFGLILLGVVKTTLGTRYIMLDGLAVPFDECIISSDGSYMFSCNSDGTVAQSYYDGPYDCSGTPADSTLDSTGATFECSGHTGYATVGIAVNIGTCIEDLYSSSIATGVCSSVDSAYAIFSCSDASTLTVTAYSDSDCMTEVGASDITDDGGCVYALGDVDYNGTPLTAYAIPTGCTSSTTEEPFDGSTMEPGSTLSTEVPPTTTEEPTTTEGPTTTQGDIPNVDLTDHVGNFFNYSLLGEFAIPIPTDICVPIELEDFLTRIYGVFSCSDDGSTVTFTKYGGGDDTCEGDAELTVSYTADEGTFDCADESNYGVLSLFIGDTCGSNVFDMYAATGQCFRLAAGGESGYVAATCDPVEESLTLWAYNDEDCTDIIGYTVIDECTTIDGLEYGGQTLYVNYGGCYLFDTTPSPTPPPTTKGQGNSDGASQLSSMITFAFVTMMCFIAAVTIV